jgi:nitrate/TMAO reductase-like tetraheme cytochrome c subunit
MMKKTLLLATILSTAAFSTTTSVWAESFTPIRDAKITAACGECHMTFFPQMLPQASWQKIIGDLSNHFGEDASLDAETQAYVLKYHMEDAADVTSTRAARKWMSRVDLSNPPDRIITAPRFIKKHSDRDFTRMWDRLNVKSKADCVACHKDAEHGIFDDD